MGSGVFAGVEVSTVFVIEPLIRGGVFKKYGGLSMSLKFNVIVSQLAKDEDNRRQKHERRRHFPRLLSQDRVVLRSSLRFVPEH